MIGMDVSRYIIVTFSKLSYIYIYIYMTIGSMVFKCSSQDYYKDNYYIAHFMFLLFTEN